MEQIKNMENSFHIMSHEELADVEGGLLFGLGVVGIYALGTLLLGPVYWAGQKFGEMVYNYLF